MKKAIKLAIVDDNAVFLEGVTIFLKRNVNYEILVVAKSGNELLLNKNLGVADIILMDIEMPEMNGIELAKKVNLTYPHIKLIAITMYHDKVYLKQLIEVGFTGFVNKAFVAEGLYNTIDEVMKNNLVFPKNISIL